MSPSTATAVRPRGPRLEEPVQRYLDHAIADGATAPRAVRMRMRGHIKLGRWLTFEAEEECDGRSFRWQAHVGRGLLEAVDAYEDGAGSLRVHLFGRVPVLRATGSDVSRSSAGRAALEAIWCPGALVSGAGVAARVVAGDEIAVSLDVGRERPEVHLRLDEEGGVRAAWANRWGSTGRGRHGYVPCGAYVSAERTFGHLTVPSEVTVGWGFGTPGFTPFFEAEITDLEPLA